MSIIYRCDICKKPTERENCVRMVAFKKWKSATKNHDRSLSSKDVCMDCYNKIFGVESNIIPK